MGDTFHMPDITCCGYVLAYAVMPHKVLDIFELPIFFSQKCRNFERRLSWRTATQV